MHIKAVTLRYSYIPFANLLRKNDNTKGAKEVGASLVDLRAHRAAAGRKAHGDRWPAVESGIGKLPRTME
jgi:hypothetical protein